MILFEQIDRDAPGSEICGLIYKDSAPSRTGIVPHIGALLRSIRSVLCRFILGCIHPGFPGMAKIIGSARTFLSEGCFESAWLLHLTEDTASPDTIDFERQHCANIAVTLGFWPVPQSLAILPKTSYLLKFRDAAV